MPRAVITNSSVNSENLLSLTPECIITWFDFSSSSLGSDRELEWSGGSALVSAYDESLEVLSQGDKYLHVPVATIVRIEFQGNESVVFLSSGDYLNTQTPLSMFNEVLGLHQFFLIHPNHLINILHMRTYVQCNAFVTLSNSDAIPVSSGNDLKIVDFLNNQTII